MAGLSNDAAEEVTAMKSTAATPLEYLASLPEDRRIAISAIRDVILANLPEGFAETMQYGMITFVVPHALYPPGYHCKPTDPLPFAALASQKNHMAVYLMSSPQMSWFKEQVAAQQRKLDIGGSCVRFKRLEALPLETLAAAMRRVTVAEHIAAYEATRKQ